MAFTTIIHNSFKQFVYELLHAATPKPTVFHAMLLNSTAFNAASTMAQLVAAELGTAGGYTRKVFTPASPALISGQYYGTQEIGWTLTQADTVQAIALIANGQVTPGNTTGLVIWIAISDQPITLVTNLEQTFNLRSGGT